jgi:hypothetical protein
MLVGGFTAGCFGSSSNGGGDGGAQDAGFDVQGPVPEGGAAEAGPEAGATDGGDAAAACPVPTGAGTTHGASITADETWRAADSPHVVPGDLAIAAGATLFLEPCAVVTIAGGHGITVNGKLAAPGTQTQPIVIKDADPANSFTCIQTANAGTMDLSFTGIQGGGSTSNTFCPAALVIGHDGTTSPAPLRVRDVILDGSKQYGVLLANTAAFTADSSNLTIKHAALGPISVSAPLAGSIPSGTYTGNVVDQIRLVADQNVAADMTLRNLGVPYYLGDATGGSAVLHVGAQATASAPAKHAVLTVEAGVTVGVAPKGEIALLADGTGTPLGALTAVGTASSPITFTSAAAAPAPGDWVGIFIANAPDPADKLDHVTVDYAGGPSGSIGAHCDAAGNQNEADDSAILILGGPPASEFVTNTTIAHSAGYGIDRGWRGSLVDFTATNTFTNVAKCSQSYPVNIGGGCPATVTCP